MSAKKIVEEIIDLNDRIVTLMESLEEQPAEELLNVLAEKHGDLLKNTNEDAPIPMALVRVVDLLCVVAKGAAKIVVQGLGHANLDIRQLSGEALITVAEDDFDEIIPAVDFAVEDKGGIVASEMPYVLSSIEDPSVAEQIAGQIIRFLDHDNIEVVVAAIESLADVGDPSAVPSLERLLEDDRTVPADEELNTEEMTVGQVAKEAIEIIEEQ